MPLISIMILVGTSISCCMIYAMHRQLKKDKAFIEEHKKYMSQMKVEISTKNDTITNIEKHFSEKEMLFESKYKFSGAKIGMESNYENLIITLWINPNTMNFIEQFVIPKTKMMEIL